MIEDQLNKHQKNKINERLKLNFNSELQKSKKLLERQKFSRNFRNHLDIFIDELYHGGVMFYGFTIIKPYLDIKDPKMWYYMHLQIEDLINYLKETIELVEFCYLSIELLKEDTNDNSIIKIDQFTGKPYIHGVLGVRSLMGRNNMHFNEIRKILNDSIDHVDITQLLSITEIKDYWELIIKENNFKFHRFAKYSDHYGEPYGSIADLELQYDPVDHIAFGLDQSRDSKTAGILGINSNKVSSKSLIIFFLNLYFFLKDYRIFNNKIFRKNNKSKFSWEIVFSLDDFSKNYNCVFEHLKNEYPQHLGRLDITELVLNDWDVVMTKVKANNNLVPRLKKIDSVIEFLDGVYYLKEEIFYKFEVLDKNIDLVIIMYVPVNFNDPKFAILVLKSLRKFVDKDLFNTILNNIKQ